MLLAHRCAVPREEAMSTPVLPYMDQRTAQGLDGDGLTDDHFHEVVRLVRQLLGRWLIKRCEDDFGTVSVLLVQDVEEGGGLTFALSRHAREINLDLRCGGGFEPLGTFRTVGRAIDHALKHVEHASSASDGSGVGGGRARREAGFASWSGWASGQPLA